MCDNANPLVSCTSTKPSLTTIRSYEEHHCSPSTYNRRVLDAASILPPHSVRLSVMKLVPLLCVVYATISHAHPSYDNLFARDQPAFSTDLFQGSRSKESVSGSAANLSYTLENGQPWFSPTAAQRAGSNGPLLLQDSHLIDNLAHFVRERIPERVVHARGAGAHGFFEVTTDFAAKHSCADVFRQGTNTSVTVRFSTVGGGRGSPDQARDPRGFAIKMRTKKGILDWVFNNTPVFFLRDPAKFPLFIHTQKTDPATNARSWDTFWSWPAMFPESLLQFLRIFSDLGTPRGLRHMNGWSGHTYRLVRDDGSWVYAKVQLTSDQGVRNFTADEAAHISGANDAWATQDLYNAIEQGNFPSWTVSFAIKTEEEAKKYRYDVLDLTKDWPEATYHKVGRLVLNQNPVNYFAEIEQSHFSPSNMVEGWEASFDPVLQSRLFSYNDAGRHRLGPNYLDIPVNCPFASVANYQRDGSGAVHGNQGARGNSPSLKDRLQTIAQPRTATSQPVAGKTVHWESKVDPKLDYEQPTMFYEKELTESDRRSLHSNIASTIVKVKDSRLVEDVLAQFLKVSPALSSGVKQALGEARKNEDGFPVAGGAEDHAGAPAKPALIRTPQ